MSDGYIGDPHEDIKLGEKIEEQIKLLSSSGSRVYWFKELSEDIEIVKKYLDWKKSGHQNLESWGTENNKRVCPA